MKKVAIIGLAMFLLVSSPAMLFAEERANDPLMGAVPFGEEYDHQPPLVWKSGTIDILTEDNIVIDDVSYELASNVRFYTEDGMRINRFSFREGTKVKFVLKNNLQTIVSLVKIR
ncbi:MAG: hypothetical protein SWH61_04885 [Thermodesulfobacteriota bacterium]|nr:hypothetical protein [Thermodesulfobacteriota bacterium]